MKVRVVLASPLGQPAQVGDHLDLPDREAQWLIRCGVVEPLEGRLEDYCDPVLRARTRASIERTWRQFLRRQR